MDDGRAQIAVLSWRKYGLIFEPNKNGRWAHSHAQLPVPVMLSNGRCRVFFAGRDNNQRSHVGWFDINLDEPTHIIEVSPQPVLEPGNPGFFDGDGIYVASAVRTGDRKLRLYTIGWNAGARPPLFYASIGAAESDDDGLICSKRGKSPILARSEFDPCLVTSPVVIRDEHGWKMWYVSGFDWVDTTSGLQSHYHIKYAYSNNGLDWIREGRVCMESTLPDETKISRFWVLHKNQKYHAWYSYHRGHGYRIGYATSIDGLDWIRKDDEAGMSVSLSGWDSEAIAYPSVIEFDGKFYMFYNGNRFGIDGVGLAISDVRDL